MIVRFARTLSPWQFAEASPSSATTIPLSRSMKKAPAARQHVALLAGWVVTGCTMDGAHRAVRLVQGRVGRLLAAHVARADRDVGGRRRLSKARSMR